jgi:hypothetical protein
MRLATFLSARLFSLMLMVGFIHDERRLRRAHAYSPWAQFIYTHIVLVLLLLLERVWEGFIL